MTQDIRPINHRLDDNGRCCGRKPIHYRGRGAMSPAGAPMLYCPRCDAEYDVATGAQRPSRKWLRRWKLSVSIRRLERGE